jgi:hypothetical protein
MDQWQLPPQVPVPQWEQPQPPALGKGISGVTMKPMGLASRVAPPMVFHSSFTQQKV